MILHFYKWCAIQLTLGKNFSPYIIRWPAANNGQRVKFVDMHPHTLKTYGMSSSVIITFAGHLRQTNSLSGYLDTSYLQRN